MAQLYHSAGSLRHDGFDLWVDPATAGWEYSGLAVLTLGAGDVKELATADMETAVLPMYGSAVVEVDGDRFELAGRTDIFREVTDFAYVPMDSEMRITAGAGGLEVALCRARATTRRDPAYVPAAAVEVEVRGGGRATRQINNFMSVEAFEADTLIAVEVITPHGNTSSFPPHKHDEHTEHETELEEIYYFRIEGDGGLGLFKGYVADGEFDETVTIRDGDVFLVPRGYHGPAVALPGFSMYYLNVMAGDQRIWRFTDDPVLAWLRPWIDEQPADDRLPMR